MNKLKFFIHVGTHKTGTTTFQTTLRENQEALLNEGIKYIEFLSLDRNRRLQLMQANSIFDEIIAEVSGFIQDNIESNISTYIISNEGLSGDPNKYYFNTKFTAEMLSRALPKTANVKILAVLRRQDEFLSSMYMQNIHQGSKVDLDAFISSGKVDSLNWVNFLSNYQALFGKENVFGFPYDRSVFDEHTIVSLLNTQINSKTLQSITDFKNKNIGFSAAARRVSELCHDSLSSEERSRLRQLLQTVSNKGLLKEYNLITRNDKQELINFFSGGNQQLARDFFSRTFPIKNYSEPIFEHAEDQEDELLKLQFTSLVKIMSHQEKLERQYNELNSLLPIRIYRKLRRLM